MDKKQYHNYIKSKSIKEHAKGFFAITAISILFMLLSFFFIMPTKLDKAKCSIPSTGIVTKFDESRIGIGMDERFYIVPVIEYSYQNEKYSSTPAVTNNKTSYLVETGDEIKILIDENNPNHIYVLNTDKGIALAYGFCIFAFILFFIALSDFIYKLFVIKSFEN